MKFTLPPSLSMVAAAGFWGGTTVLSKHALGQCAPLPLLLLQLLSSCAFLWFMTMLKGQRLHGSWRPVFKKASYGALEPGLAYIFILYGLQNSTASCTAILTATEPLMVLLLRPYFKRERLSRIEFGWGTLGMFGVSLTVLDGGAFGGSVVGIAALLLGTLLAALYVTLSDKAADGESALVIAALQQTAGLCVVGAIAALFTSTGTGVFSFSWNVFGTAVTSGVLQYGLAFWAYVYAIQGLPVGNAAMYLNLIPVFGIFSARIFLGETLSYAELSGALVIIVALIGLAGAKREEVRSIPRHPLPHHHQPSHPHHRLLRRCRP